MQSQQSIEVQREKPSLLSKAGLMTLQKEKYQQFSERQGHRGKILQQVNNDDQFMQLPNVSTSYLPNNISSNNSSIVYQPENKSYRREEKKQVMETQDIEYQDVTRKIRQNSQAAFSNINKKKYERVKKFHQDIDNELQDVQEIIGEIQKLMEDSLANSKVQSQFKKDTAVVNHSAKRHFQTKGIRSFGESKGIDKLEEMLLSYQTDDPQMLKETNSKVEVVLKDPVLHRRAKHQQRMNRFKEINEVSQSITSPQGIPEAINKSEVLKSRKVDQNKLGLQNIEILQIDWFKLPLFLSPLSPQCSQLLLKMKQYPDDESFWLAINESLPKETEYSAYSIFNSHFQAGLKKERTLMSEEQFREKWAQEWSYEIDEEEHKELLCQLDFQWYRSLVEATYTQSIEDLLVKNISYSWEQFHGNLKKIHGIASNDKNKNSLPLYNLITQNKLKYVEALLNSLTRDKVEKTHSAQLFVAVVPNMGQSQSKEVFESLKVHVKEIFVGGLYASDSSGSSMGVIITKKQASDCEVKKWQGGRVQLGSVQLVINQPQGGDGDRIHLTRTKSKNSAIRLRVFRPGEEGIDLQVGEELYLGRRYHILLD